MKEPQFFTYVKYSFGECLLNAATHFLIVALFIWSDIIILGDISSDWELESGQKLLLFGVAALFICVNEFAISAMKKGQNLIRLVMELVALGWMALYIRNNWRDIYEGVLDVMSQAIDIHNHESVSGFTDEMGTVLTLLILFLTVFSLFIAFITKHVGGSMIIPLALQAVALAVNIAPSSAAIVLSVVGIILCSAGGMSQQDISLKKLNTTGVQKTREIIHRLLIRGACIACAFAIMFITSLLFGEVVENLSENRTALIEKQKEIIGEVAGKIENPFGNGNNKGQQTSDVTAVIFNNQLDNTKPEYTYKEIMTISTDNKPLYNVYLKNESLGKYKNNKWLSIGKSTYEQDTVETAYNRLKDYASKDSLIRYQVSYSEDFEKENETEYHFYNSDHWVGVKSWYNAVAYSALLPGDVSLYVDSVNNTTGYLGYYDWDSEWSYAIDHYLELGISEESLKGFIEKVRESEYFNKAQLIAEDTSISAINAYNIYMALAVQSAFKSYAYSLNLSEVPDGEDPVEFFLNKSHAGYCMHFASGGVMALRYLGVPARYANGYIVKAGSFRQNQDKYSASVKDKDAHAWVEIYLINVGWVPVEVTNGYGNVNSNVNNGNPDTETETEKNTETQKPSQQPSEETETQTETETSPNTEKPAESESQENSQSGIDVNTEGEDNTKHSSNKNPAKAIIIVVIILAILSAAGYMLVQIRKDQEKLAREIHRKLNVAAVRHMNRNMYKRLRRRGRVTKDMTDQAYEEALVKTYTDISPAEWKEYMSIVKKATFSRDVITDEELAHVRAVYTHKRSGQKS